MVPSCDKGYYLTKKFRCQLCPVGTWSIAGAKKCTTCPAGTKTADHFSCKDCAAGKYSPAGSARCKLCGVGQVSQIRSPNCTICTSGQYASHSDNICKPCERGYFSTGSVDSCTICAAGSYALPGDPMCTVCSTGHYLYRYDVCGYCGESTYAPDPYTACTKCPAGSVKLSRDSVCEVCDVTKGYVTNIAQSKCICPQEGEFDVISQKCSVCKPGSKMKTGGGGCEECGPRTYSARIGSKTCFDCNTNKLVNADKTRCDYCPASFFKQNDICTKCPAGQYSTASIKGCRKCLGLSKVNEDQTGCVATTAEPTAAPFIPKVCLPGQGYSAETCTDCGPGNMSADQKCIPCAVGTYSDATRATSCTPCPPPKVVSADRTQCNWCEPSFYRQEYPQDYPKVSPGREAKCLKCPSSTYSTDQGTGCLECPNYTPVNADQTGCEPVPPGPIVLPNPPRAPPGKYYDSGTKMVLDCPAGSEKLYSFQNCNYCNAGWYAPLPGTAVCKICDSSKVVNRDRTDCQSCLGGYTKVPFTPATPYTAEKEAHCAPCDPYTYSDGGSPCKKCPQGLIPNRERSACVYPGFDGCGKGNEFDPETNECVVCGPGTNSIFGDAWPCRPCWFNSYQPYAGMHYCDKCPLSMATGYGRDDCYFCEASRYRVGSDWYGQAPWDNGQPSHCDTCPEGTYSVYADIGCHTCPAGKKVNAGQTGCE
jgi:hypothetical protein